MSLLDEKGFSILALAVVLPFPWSFQYSVIDRFAISIFPCLQALYLVADQTIYVDKGPLKNLCLVALSSARVIKDQGSRISAGVNRCSFNYANWVYPLLQALSKQSLSSRSTEMSK